MLISHEHGNYQTQSKERNEAFLKMASMNTKSNFGLNMLSWLRLAALVPWSRSSTKNQQKLRKQFHHLRKFMIHKNTLVPHERKRKLEVFLEDQPSILRNSIQHISKKVIAPIPPLGSPNFSPSSNASMTNQESIARKPLMNQQRVQKLLPRSGMPVKVVPVGMRFQANIPQWPGSSNKGMVPYDTSDSKSLKWLGFRMWPMKTPNSDDKDLRVIGKGRSGSCSCRFPRSSDCIKIHVLEERHVLKTSLGFAYYVMKFDEMGDEVSKFWSLSEKETFKGFIRSFFSECDFWKNMCTCFPFKLRENVISYYYNVYIPNEIMQRRRRFLKQAAAAQVIHCY